MSGSAGGRRREPGGAAEGPERTGSAACRYRTLLFDWDGTMADSREAILASFAATFAHFDEPAPAPAVIEATIGMRLGEAMVRLCPRAGGHEEEWLAVYRRHSLRQEALRTRLFDGIAEVVAMARRRGLQVGVVSNKSQAGLEGAARRFFADAALDFLVGTAAGRPRKPDGALFHTEVLPRLGHHQPSQVLMIGDTAIDLEFARNAGIDSCWAGYGYGQRRACEAMAPTLVVEHPAGIAVVWGGG